MTQWWTQRLTFIKQYFTLGASSRHAFEGQVFDDRSLLKRFRTQDVKLLGKKEPTRFVASEMVLKVKKTQAKDFRGGTYKFVHHKTQPDPEPEVNVVRDIAVLSGGGYTPTDADPTVHPYVIGLSKSDKDNLPHLLGWMDYIQSKKQAAGKSEAATEKKKVPEKVADDKDNELSVSLLKIQVGLIRKASKHPSADRLLVEEIDVGEGKCRQVVSGLAKFCSPDDLTNHLVALITNVKPGKLRGVVSEGLVLCASNADHTAVQPLIVPEGAKIGECVAFSGHEGKPEAVLNPKKKQLDKITPNLFTDEKGVATFNGVPFMMTSVGPFTSTIPNGSVKF